MQVHRFSPQLGAKNLVNDHGSSAKATLGGKGANLAEMCSLGYPVPPGITIATSGCNEYLVAKDKPKFMSSLMKSIAGDLAWLQSQTQYLPLFSVRSGARVSMPGMMDTVLNVGMSLETMPKFEEQLGARTAWDSYRRFLQMYGTVVLGAPDAPFESILESYRHKYNVEDDGMLPANAMEDIAMEFRGLYGEAGAHVPETLEEQVKHCIEAVFQSWNNERAKHYRAMHGYSDNWGTAVNIQMMVFGNRDDLSASGVLFTRNPATGDGTLIGEYLINAQGEDVVAGIRTPAQLDEMYNIWPGMYKEICELALKTEKHYRDMQDMEFTIESGKLWMLQTRNGKRTSRAAFKIALDLVAEGVLTLDEAMKRVDYSQWKKLGGAKIMNWSDPDAVGIPGGGKVVTGRAALSSPEAVASASTYPTILVAKETTPEDIKGMEASVGILTTTGGATSHAAVVARGMDKTCVVGCPINLDEIEIGDWLTIDGSNGYVWKEKKEIVDEAIPEYAVELVVMYARAKGIRLRTSAFLSGAEEVEIPYQDFEHFADMVQLIAKYREQGTKVYVDLTTVDDLLEDADLNLLRAFGTGKTVFITEEMIKNALAEEGLTDIGYVVAGAVVPEAKTVAELVSQFSTPSPELIASLGGPAVATVVFDALKAKALLPEKSSGTSTGVSVAKLMYGC